jgi:hypothetical protein
MWKDASRLRCLGPSFTKGGGHIGEFDASLSRWAVGGFARLVSTPAQAGQAAWCLHREGFNSWHLIT